jgi:hypothetical protein
VTMNDQSRIDEVAPVDKAVDLAAPVNFEDLAISMYIADYIEELDRLADVITGLRRALDEALTCPGPWCMCEAHELLRSTEPDEEPYR